MNIYSYFLLFLIYAVLGWIVEIIDNFRANHKFVNRGFFIGPYCPIYGFGGLAMFILLNRYYHEPLVLFIMSIVIFSLLEYFTSYFMELLFKARWWDYSNNKFNINGRICLETMIPFGILGCLVTYVINPILISFILSIPNNIVKIIAIILFVIFVTDIVITLMVMSNITLVLPHSKKMDSTEEITQKFREILLSKSILYRRIATSFPKMKLKRIKFR